MSKQENVNHWEEAGIKFPVELGVVGRFDAELRNHGFKRVLIPTPFGLMDRSFWGMVDGKSMLVIYGRFDKDRSLAENINFEKTQAAFNALGVKTIIGTFVVGGIKKEYRIGSVFIVSDLVGLGGYGKSLYKEGGFKNTDMYMPFCEEIRGALGAAANEVGFPVYREGIYACFHGYPRIETKAELDFYARMGWDIVGQTLDPEATLARESRCCYAAVAVTIDDPMTRGRFMSGERAARMQTQDAITIGRQKTTELVFKALKHIPDQNQRKCVCGHDFHSEKNHFRYLPDYLLNAD